MKNFILKFGVLALLASIFVSCHKEEGKKIRPTRLLLSSTYQTVGVNMETKLRDTIIQNLNYEFDPEVRIVKIFDSNGYVETYDHKNLLKTSYENSVHTASGIININGSVACDSALNGSYKKEYSYDENGYIKGCHFEFVVDESNRSYYTYSYSWKGGNIVSCQVKDGGIHNGAAMELGVYDYQYEYTNETVTTPIENKTGMVFLFDNVMDFSYVFGKKCKNLPVAVNNQKIEWTLDEEGYPVKVVTNKATATFMWK